MTTKDKESLENASQSMANIRRIAWNVRTKLDKGSWFFLTKSGVQTIQLNKALGKFKGDKDVGGMVSTTMELVAKWLIKNG